MSLDSTSVPIKWHSLHLPYFKKYNFTYWFAWGDPMDGMGQTQHPAMWWWQTLWVQVWDTWLSHNSFSVPVPGCLFLFVFQLYLISLLALKVTYLCHFLCKSVLYYFWFALPLQSVETWSFQLLHVNKKSDTLLHRLLPHLPQGPLHVCPVPMDWSHEGDQTSQLKTLSPKCIMKSSC